MNAPGIPETVARARPYRELFSTYKHYSTSALHFWHRTVYKSAERNEVKLLGTMQLMSCMVVEKWRKAMHLLAPVSGI